MKKYLIISLLAISLNAQASEIRLLQPTLWDKAVSAVLSIQARINGYFTHNLGSTITTINGTDQISASRTTINTNFTNLNNSKIESSTTSVQSITTLSNLSIVGTITSGTWNGSVLTTQYGGLGVSTTTAWTVLLGSGTNGHVATTSGGTSGQFLTHQGNSPPIWTTASFNSTIDYSLSGRWNFTNTVSASTSINIASTSPASGVNLAVNGGALISGTTTLSKLVIASSTAQINGLNTTWPSSQSTTSVLVNDGNGILSYQKITEGSATTTKKGFVGLMVIPHSLGRVPTMLKVTAQSYVDITGTQEFAMSTVVATSTGGASQNGLAVNYRAGLIAIPTALVANNEIISLRRSDDAETFAASLQSWNSTSFTLNITTNTNATQEGLRMIMWELW